MSSKYTASKQGRTHGRYAKRLERRGVSNTEVRMPSLRHLRNAAGVSTKDLPASVA